MGKQIRKQKKTVITPVIAFAICEAIEYVIKAIITTTAILLMTKILSTGTKCTMTIKKRHIQIQNGVISAQCR